MPPALLGTLLACLADVTAITNVTLIPTHTPEVLTAHTILIRDGRIDALGPDIRVPPGATVIDGRGRYVMPGLVDMHEHLPRGKEEHEPSLDSYFDLQLAAGITTMRSMRGAPGDIALRESIEKGHREGPRLILGSPGINADIAPDPQTARRAIRRFAKEGYDFLKILEGFSATTFEAIVDEANAQGMSLAGHLPKTIPLSRALTIPFHTIEHLHGHADARAQDPEGFGDLARKTAQAGVWVCPTLGFQISWYAQEDLATLNAYPGMEFVAPALIERWREGAQKRMNVELEERASFDLTIANRFQAIRTLADEGVGLLVSASGGYFLVPGFSMHVEFRYLRQAGLTPREILTAATYNAARCEGEESSWGTIAEGQSADLVVLRSDPLADLAGAMDIDVVIRRGVVYDRRELERRLEVIRHQVHQGS